MRPAQPGPRLASGRLRVDAARAIAKLREYQLPDRAAWIVEGVRAAVASGAERIEIDGDANDVWLSWSGPAWPPEVLPRLLDELVSPEPSRDAQHLRLLATAINSSLGLDPAYVDLFAIDPAGAAAVVRYTPEVLELPPGDDQQPALRQLECRPAERPRRAPAPGMHLHLRRRAGLETLGTFLRRDDPPEIPVALSSCRDSPVPVRVGRTELGRERWITDLVRVELGEGLDGFLALLDPSWATTQDRPIAEIAERGAVIARYSIDLGLEATVRPMPLRLFVDAPRMPSNASRSAVRREAHPIAAAERRARELVAPLVERVVTELGDESTPGERREALRDAALALLASVAEGPDWVFRLRELSEPLASLARLELVRNAVGRAMPVATRWSPDAVHDGREPLDPELEPWLAEVLWTPPGDPAARLVETAAIDPRALDRRVKRGRKRLKNQRRFMSHATRELALTRSRGDWIRAAIGAAIEDTAIADDRIGGATGELVVSNTIGAEVTFVYEGRPLETVEIEIARESVGLRATVSHPRLQAADSFREVVRDEVFADVIKAVIASAVRAIEALALAAIGQRLAEVFRVEQTPDDHQLARLVRAGFELASSAGLLVRAGPLMAAPAWPVAGGGRLSVAEIRELEVVGFAAGLVPEIDRVILTISPAQQRLLEPMIAGHTAIVRYDSMQVVRGGDLAGRVARQLATEPGSAALAIRERGRRGAIAWGVRSASVEAYHAGAPIADVDLEIELTDAAVIIDCDALIPTLSGTLLTNPEILTEPVAAWQRSMARAIARALCGQAVPDLVVNGTFALDRGAGLALCEAICRADPTELLGDELVAQLREASIVAALGELAAVSPAELARRFPGGSIPALIDAGALEPVAGWTPMVVSSEVEARAIGRLLDRRTHLADRELGGRRRQAERQAMIDAFRRNPALDWPVAGPGEVDLAHGVLAGVVRLGRGDRLEIQVRIEGRDFERIDEPGPPLQAVVEAPLGMANRRFTALREKAFGEIRRAVADRAIDLLWRNLEDPTSLADNPRVRALALSLIEDIELDAVQLDRLRRLPAFPTLQGPRTSIADAELVGLVRVASWGGEWLGPLETADPLDLAVVSIERDGAGESLRRLVHALATEGAIDETPAVARLQVARAMARGILPRPVIAGVPRALVRDLAELGADGQALGAGEIALIDAEVSRVAVHELGVWIGDLEVDVSPPVHVALEAPELVEQIGGSIRSAVLASRVQKVAAALVAELAGGELPAWVDRHLAVAFLSRRIEPGPLAERPVYETTAGERVGFAALRAQAGRFGDVWYVPMSATGLPLDPGRLAIRLDEAGLRVAGDAPVKMVEATGELELDARARANRDRSPVSELALPAAVTLAALDVVELEGDGLTAPRGVVAVLAPDAGSLRGVSAHREMKPMGELDDPCEWPTRAVVDDRRLSPDRTWSQPQLDEALREVLKAIQRASERVLDRMTAVPRGALASRVIWNLYAGTAGVVGRGRLWLPERWEVGTVVVEYAAGEIRHHPVSERGRPLPVSGKLLIYAPGAINVGEAIDRLVRRRYGELIESARILQGKSDLVVAHAAVALEAGLIEPDDVAGLEFPCFSPEPIGPADLVELLDGLDTADPVLVDDGSLLSQVLISLLGVSASEPEASLPVEVDAEEPVPSEHPLAALAREVSLGLSRAGLRHLIDEVGIRDNRTYPIDLFDGELTLGAASELIQAIEAARQARSPWAAPAIDALVAHAITRLAEEIDHVTEGEQMRALERLLDRG